MGPKLLKGVILVLTVVYKIQILKLVNIVLLGVFC